jgi:hypothetical protein
MRAFRLEDDIGPSHVPDRCGATTIGAEAMEEELAQEGPRPGGVFQEPVAHGSCGSCKSILE